MESEAVRQFFGERDRLAKRLGFTLGEVRKGFARAEVELADQHLNSAGSVHGGTLFSLADLAFGAAANSHGSVALAVSASISFVKAVRSGRLIAEAREVSLGRKIATYVAEIRDWENDIVALFKCTVYRKKDRLEDLT